MKSTVDEIRQRFDADVERFSNLDTGQSATVDAPLAMALVAQAAAATTPHARHFLDVGVVLIGDFTLFGPAVQIYTATHPMNAELRRKQEFAKPIEIGSDVWVGGGAIICPGVKIGSRSVIGAGSVVTRDIPEGVFAAGNPCGVIREITEKGQELR